MWPASLGVPAVFSPIAEDLGALARAGSASYITIITYITLSITSLAVRVIHLPRWVLALYLYCVSGAYDIFIMVGMRGTVVDC